MKELNKKEIAWLIRLQKTLNKQPETLVGYCTGTEIDFFKGKGLPPDGHGGVNSNEIKKSIKNKNWDAGAY